MLQIIGFLDASFASNRDYSSQLCYIILTSDKNYNFIPLSLKFFKARRIVRFAMSAEVILFSDMSDSAITSANEIYLSLNKYASFQLFTDSKYLFRLIITGSQKSEKQTVINIAASREAFRERIISDIGFVCSTKNIADCLIKTMNQPALRTVLRNGTLHTEAYQWIVRDSQEGNYYICELF